MISCPKCKAENRTGAKFCVNCSNRLPDSPDMIRPGDADTGELAIPYQAFPMMKSASVTRRLDQTRPGGTKPLGVDRPFVRRPEGAIFGDNYLSEALISSDEDQHIYEVNFLERGPEMQIQLCPNPSCGAIFPPRTETPEMFCTDCGTALEKGGRGLILIESRSPVPEVITRVAAKGLSHGSVRAPLAAFIELLGGEPRHCLVLPRIQKLGEEKLSSAPETKILIWGISLAKGLDYLHDNGYHFNGHVDSTCVGFSGERAAWVEFSFGSHHPDGYVTERLPDTRSLAQMVYFWLSGETKYSPGLELSASLLRPFDLAIMTDSVQNGAEFARLLENALQEIDVPQNVKIESGHRSDVGRVRNLNEDSLMTLELNQTRQSLNHAIGIYVVADGMGGHDSGEVASGSIIDTFSRIIFQDLMPSLLKKNPSSLGLWLKKTVEVANEEVYDLRRTAGNDMGSTLVAVAIEGNRAFITHIGDSRAYLIHEGKIRQITVDHSLVERMIASNQISRADARNHPQRNVIYRTIGDKPNIEVEVIEQDLSIGDRLLLCSDGLSGMMEDQIMEQIVISTTSEQEACDLLVRTANAAGGGDNISVVLVKIVAD